MLKNFWKKRDEVKFGLVDNDSFILKNFPIVSYKKYIHKFVKQPGINRCPGLVDYYEPFYVIPMWFDLEIYFNKYEPSQIELEYNPYHKKSISWHDPDLTKTKQNFGNNFFHKVIKLNTPWTFKLPKGYAVSVRALDYGFDSHFYPFPGLQYDSEPVLTLPILLRQDLGSFRISAGDPLVILQIINMNEKKINIVSFEDDLELNKNTKYFWYAEKSTIPKGLGNKYLDKNSPHGLTKLYNKTKGT